jgi:hypothetical protein
VRIISTTGGGAVWGVNIPLSPLPTPVRRKSSCFFPSLVCFSARPDEIRATNERKGKFSARRTFHLTTSGFPKQKKLSSNREKSFALL